jgi:hypothetical protein
LSKIKQEENMGGEIKMSNEECNRLKILELLAKGFIKHRKAAENLGITTRQTKRLLKEYRKIGNRCVVSKKRGKPGNRRHKDEFKKRIKIIIKKRYADFGPKFAAEKLQEEYCIKISKECLRKYMIEWGIRKAQPWKFCNVHPQRPRRECFGELVQIDGSPHEWFEDRGEKCCLIVFIDDATSKILSMLFVPTETTQAYFSCAKKYIKKYGAPLAFYSDRHGIFRVNKVGAEGKETQFGRAMRELGISTIFAHSPQAKGRVERANRTLQDRLVKELRLKNISNIDAANNFLEKFIENHNKKFSKEAKKEIDVHRKNVLSDVMLDAILCERYYRKLTKNLEFSFENSTYQVVAKIRSLRDTQTVICKFANGALKIWHNGAFVECKEFKSYPKNTPTASGKEINDIVDKLSLTNADKKAVWSKVPFLRLVNRSQQNNIVPL